MRMPVVGSVRLVRSVLRLLANPVELAFWKKFCTAAGLELSALLRVELLRLRVPSLFMVMPSAARLLMPLLVESESLVV